MTYVIAEPCVNVIDQACVAVCPVDCIHWEEGVDRMLYIDPDECIDCGACEPECPVNAIFPEESLPPAWILRRPSRGRAYRDAGPPTGCVESPHARPVALDAVARAPEVTSCCQGARHPLFGAARPARRSPG
jgi:NAD-dependent dihydropyrimidine dehydrogenase PreA subunit